MRQLRAILGDSFRQAWDRKVLLILLLLSLCPILFCFSISFESQPLEERIGEVARQLNRFTTYHGGYAMTTGIHGNAPDVGPVEAPEQPQAWPEEIRKGHTVAISFKSNDELDSLVRDHRRIQQSTGKRPSPNREGGEDNADRTPLPPEERSRFFEDRFQQQGFNHVHVIEEPGTPGAYRIGLATDYPEEVRGAHTLRMLFGQVEVPLEDVSVAEFVIQLELVLAGVFAGFVVMLIAISTTATFIPDMLRKGTLDLVLARPIGRIRLLLYRYLGGLWFVGIFAGFLIAGCWLGLALRTGVSSPAFLLCIFSLLAVFAVLYSVSVLVGILTRSSGLASLTALGVWGASSLVVSIRHNIETLFPNAETPRSLKIAVEVLYTILPKVRDLGHLNTLVLSRSQLSPEAFGSSQFQMLPEIDWVFSLGTTALFTAVMLALACWWFWRRDW